jgi:uncharacterized protein YgiM (DUF1202 family)
MRLRSSLSLMVAIAITLLAAGSARAGTAGYAACGTYGSYVLMYKSVDNMEELGHLRCGEKVEVLMRWTEYFQVRTQDGRVGWVNYTGISSTPPATESSKNFGMTDTTVAKGPAVAPLTNTDVMKMSVMHLGADVIIAKIKSSPCEFDTTPAAMRKAKQAGVPDKVILAMVQAPLASAVAESKKPEFVEVKVPRFTPIELELAAAVSSDAAQDGMLVPLTVSQDVVLNGVTVIQKGADARARVTTLKQPGFMNRPPGEISWTLEFVTSVTGGHISAMFYDKAAAANPMAKVMGAAGPSWEFKKGKPAVVAAGQRFETVVQEEAVVRLPAAQAAAGAQTAPQNAASASQPMAQTSAPDRPLTKP